jgi:hypothetical protein
MALTGIGGFCFRALDTKALTAWDRKHFAIGLDPHGVWQPPA